VGCDLPRRDLDQRSGSTDSTAEELGEHVVSRNARRHHRIAIGFRRASATDGVLAFVPDRPSGRRCRADDHRRATQRWHGSPRCARSRTSDAERRWGLCRTDEGGQRQRPTGRAVPGHCAVVGERPLDARRSDRHRPDREQDGTGSRRGAGVDAGSRMASPRPRRRVRARRGHPRPEGSHRGAHRDRRPGCAADLFRSNDGPGVAFNAAMASRISAVVDAQRT